MHLHMRIVPTLAWRVDGDSGPPLGPRLLPLLQAIAEQPSLAAAVVACRISYRAAWGLLRDYEVRLGVSLVRLERGRGARLDVAGEALLRAHAKATQRLAKVLPMLEADLGGAKAAKLPRPSVALRIAASHDLCLATLLGALPASSG